MANEWTKVELYGANNDGNPRRFTIADGTSISQGQLLALTDPRTVTAATGATQQWAGVASEDHLANEGVTSISVWTDGIFDATASDAIAIAGEGIKGAEDNTVHNQKVVASGANVIGYALETAADEEVINVRLRL